MNKLFSKIAALSVGLALAVGVGVAAGQKDYVAVHAEQVTLTTSSLSGTSTDGNIAWSAGQGGASTAPGIYSDAIRLYQGSPGGYIRLEGKNGAKINGFSAHNDNEYAGVARYLATDTLPTGNPSSSGSNESVAKNSNYSKTGLNSKYVFIICYGGSKTARLEINSITVTYTISNEATLTYDANGGTGSLVDPNSPYNKNTNVTTLDNSFTAPNGYKFSCWNTQADGNGTDYAAGAQFTITANTTLYAKWTPKNLTNLRIAEGVSKTKYYEGSHFNGNGLVVYASYEGVEELVNIVSDVVWNEGNALTVGQTSVTGYLPADTGKAHGITVDGLTVLTMPYQNSSKLEPGDYYISGASKYLSGVSGNVGTMSSDKSDGLLFTFSLVADNKWTVMNNDKYLRITGTDSKNLALNATAGHFVVIDGATDGTYKLRSFENNARSLSLYNDAEIRTYANQNATDFALIEPAFVTSYVIEPQAGAQTRFLKGSEFDPTTAGYKAILGYSDGTTIDITSDSTWNLDTSTVKLNAEITATYGDKEASIGNIEIYSIKLAKLSVDATNAKTDYFTGATLLTNGLVVNGLDGDDQIILANVPLDKLTFSPTVLNTAGEEIEITVSYVNDDESVATGTYNVTVTDFVGYARVNSQAELQYGDEVVLGAHETNRLMGAPKSDYRDYVTSTHLVDNFTAVTSEGLEAGVNKFVIGYGTVAGTFTLINGDYFLKINSTSTGKLESTETLTSNCDLKIVVVDGIPHIRSNAIKIDSQDVEILYNNGSPRFAGYKVTSTNVISVDIYRKAGSADLEAARTFTSEKMKMSEYVGDNTYNEERCTANYGAAKSAYLALSVAAKNLFGNSEEFADARERLGKWAEANHENFNSSDGTFVSNHGLFASQLPFNAGGVVIIIVGTIALTAIGLVVVLRKKKEQ